MKKIFERARYACEHWRPWTGCELEDLKALADAVKERIQLEQTPITEEWLKEHGFVKIGNKPGAFYVRWGHSNTIMLSFDDGSCDFSIEKSTGYMHFDRANKHNATLADLYDACELCGIELTTTREQ